MPVDLDLRRVRFFVEVVRQGGFSAAGKVLFATQSTVSKAVQHLEDDLDAVLLQRLGNRSDLTDEGRIVYDKGLQLLDLSSQLRTELDALKGLRAGRLTVGFPGMGTSSQFAAAFAAFTRSFPAVELRVLVHSVPELLQHLRAGVIEVAALFEPAGNGIDFRPAVVDELFVVLPSAHPLARLDSVSCRDLETVPLILFEDEMPAAALVLRAFADAGVEPRIWARVSQLPLLLELVGSGAGAGFVPGEQAQAFQHRSTRVVRLSDARIPWQIGFGWVRGRYLSHAASAWLQLLAGAGQR
ncbi:LysR family transcriptional regulator [Ramlibacter sp. AN1133]|uniref:LysR family transcriptional regulator n=1 Tax=Ramlibacter sp. AN1133 TaxID=3133429 RepID=UPI0030C0D4B4